MNNQHKPKPIEPGCNALVISGVNVGKIVRVLCEARPGAIDSRLLTGRVFVKIPKPAWICESLGQPIMCLVMPAHELRTWPIGVVFDHRLRRLDEDEDAGNTQAEDMLAKEKENVL